MFQREMTGDVEGSKGLAFFENCLRALGDSGQLTTGGPLAQLYWLL